MSEPKLGWFAQAMRLFAKTDKTAKATRPTTMTTPAREPAVAPVVTASAAATASSTPVVLAAANPEPTTTATPAKPTSTPSFDLAAVLARIKATEPAMTNAQAVHSNPLAPAKSSALTHGGRVASPTATKPPAAGTVTHAADPFRLNVSHTEAYAIAIADADWKLDVSTPASLALTKGAQRLHVDSIIYGLRDWLAARGYHPADNVFAQMASTVVLDVLSAIPKTASLLPA